MDRDITLIKKPRLSAAMDGYEVYYSLNSTIYTIILEREELAGTGFAPDCESYDCSTCNSAVIAAVRKRIDSTIGKLTTKDGNMSKVQEASFKIEKVENGYMISMTRYNNNTGSKVIKSLVALKVADIATHVATLASEIKFEGCDC